MSSDATRSAPTRIYLHWHRNVAPASAHCAARIFGTDYRSALLWLGLTPRRRRLVICGAVRSKDHGAARTRVRVRRATCAEWCFVWTRYIAML